MPGAALRLLLLFTLFNKIIFPQLAGSGTESDPFLISDAGDFNYIREIDTTGIWFYKQTVNLELPGSGSMDIRGTYDGNNFTVSNFASSLFENVSGTVKNLNIVLATGSVFVHSVLDGGKVQNCTVTIPDSVGIYFGGIAITSAGLIEDCRVIMLGSGHITGTEVYSSGGIVGNQIGPNSVIRRCSVTGGKITGGLTRGGIAGEAVRIEQCLALTNVEVGPLSGSYSGGIAGKLLSSTSPAFNGLIEDSYFRGAVTGYNGTASFIGQFRGGIVGYAMENTSIIRCYTSSSLMARSNSAPAVGFVENNVTITDVLWDAEVQGYFNQLRALQFDGIDDHAIIPLDLTAFPEEFTIEAWVYWAGGDPGQRVFDFGNDTSGYMYFTPSYGGNPRFAITTSGVSGEQGINASAPLAQNTWNHIAITIDTPSTTARLYINGVLADSNEALAPRPFNLGATFNNYFGRSQFEADPYFNGMIDEVRIWSVALNKDTINEWKYRYVTSDHPNWGNLVSYYKLNETSGTTIVNQIDPVLDGTLFGEPAFTADLGAAPVDRGVAKWTSEMKDQSVFIAANYNTSVWSREEGYNDGYMYLLWEKNGLNPLPVELISFTARATAAGITLNWETATEISNAGFEVERKTPGSLWQKIAFIEGHYTTNSPKYYSFTDQPSVNGTVFYRLKQIDTDGSFEYSAEIKVESGIPQEYSLSANYPNPFNPATTVDYSLPVGGFVSVKLYNSQGREVATIFNESKEAGYHSFTIDAAKYSLASGVYFYRISAGNFTMTRKMLLLK
ncbi:MAG: T9SS type A sorting domain-containing protein [Ignavibacteria bacterium]|nr:T9SS type A sorting domain-containing protein [Ignavibacteria bacterium]